MRGGGNRHEGSPPHLEFNHSEPCCSKNGCAGSILGSFWALTGPQAPPDVLFRVPWDVQEKKIMKRGGFVVT